ncbi:hypothetical protein ABZ806_30445 [Spirillospora sp. NPDC047418]|jgi:hypothetical protein
MLEAMITWIADMAHHAAHLITPVTEPPHIPNPGQGEKPPFADQFLLIFRYGVYFASGCGVAGYIIVGVRMTLQHRRGEGGGHMASVIIVTGGCIFIVFSYKIVTTVTS